MLGSSPAGITKWPLGLMVRTAASQAANVEFKSRRGHLWVGRIAAIAADCKSADLGLRWFESNPAHYMFACPRWVMVPLRSTAVVAEQVPLAPSDLLRWCAGNCTEGSNHSANAI